MSNRQDAEPSLSALSFALRHKEIWPEGFRWEYSSCSHCAMGLAAVMWPKKVATHDVASMVNAFGMKESDASRIFLGSNQVFPEVTPERIADLIDAL